MAKDTPLDRLFQLPPGEFTAARNALAKEAGKDGAAICGLSKPPLAAWAVNQLYWKDQDRYQALIRAATEMRGTHKAVIEGKRADLRAAGREHELALEAALKSTLGLLKDAGHPATEATRQAIVNTLRALPSDEAPGRLTRTLAPGGFEMLAGITPAPAPKKSGKAATAESGPAAKGGSRDVKAKADPAAKAREQRAADERAVRDADQRARHAEFEAARAARDATKAARRLEDAERALAEAKTEVEEARRESTRATRHKEEADRRAEEAASVLERARSKLG